MCDQVVKAAQEWRAARTAALRNITGDGRSAVYLERLAKAEAELSEAVRLLTEDKLPDQPLPEAVQKLAALVDWHILIQNINWERFLDLAKEVRG
jgi:hypothetical protein